MSIGAKVYNGFEIPYYRQFSSKGIFGCPMGGVTEVAQNKKERTAVYSLDFICFAERVSLKGSAVVSKAYLFHIFDKIIVNTNFIVFLFS